MPREAIPFATDDISTLAKSLRDQLAGKAEPPGHVELLNMLARAAGARNFQHYRASAVAEGRLTPASGEPPADLARVEKVARQFDDQGRLMRWPSRSNHQDLALWGLWAALEPGRAFTEQEISAALNTRHLFGDPAILRRSMVNQGLVSRTQDCRDYRRVERRPPPDARALIARLKVG